MITNLTSFIDILRREGDLCEISTEVDPYLEAAEIHRRVIAHEGPALLFSNIKGAAFPLVTNLFGTRKRIELAFGRRPEEFMKTVAKLPETMVPPTPTKLWGHRKILRDLLRVGMKHRRGGAVTEVIELPPKLSKLPLLTTWELDGGPFVTLPLVYTEHPVSHVSNLGMYRIQRYDDATTGLHCQIGKGGGFHLAEAKRLGKKLPVNIHIGGPPALILSAIAPLPENVPELLLASLVQGSKMQLAHNPLGPLPVISESEFVLVGEVDPNESRPEGPFGDHYGYYSLQHDYPVFHCHGVLRKRAPICAATVVGKPRQEDFYLGDYLQELLAPLFPVVMPTVKDLWSYGETGYHSLAAAVVRQRYKREAMVSAFRILGEGQLSLTKFLLILDREMDLRDFPRVLEHVLARADFRTDLYVFSNLSMDTLDYNGPRVNEGSKGVLLGVGDPIRELPGKFSGGLSQNCHKAIPFCKGCLVLEGASLKDDPELGDRLVNAPEFREWPLLILVDDAVQATANSMNFLWTAFTRFEPGRDIKSHKRTIQSNHLSYEPPILIDCRLKPDFPAELECDPKTDALVTKRWREYFPNRDPLS